MRFWQGVTEQGHDPVTYAIPAFFVFIVLEALALRSSVKSTAGYERRDTRASLIMGVGSSLIGTLWRAATLIVYQLIYVHLAPWHLRSNVWFTWVFVLVGVDLLWYAYHRFSHRVRIAWAAHQAHHSSVHFNLSTALRQKWNPWFEGVFWLPLPLLGVPPWMIYTAFSANLIFQFWIHTERIERMPAWFEFVFNTPSHHRVHHGSDQLYLDRNYGGILIIWDRLFATYQVEEHRPTYGLTHPVTTFNPVRLQYFEYAALAHDVRRAHDWHERFGYLAGPPGWAPERVWSRPAGCGRTWRMADADVADSKSGSRWSLWSKDSFLSIGSRGSFLSIGSVGSFASIASIGSFGSLLSVGSSLSLGSVLSERSRWSLMSSGSIGAIMAARNRDV